MRKLGSVDICFKTHATPTFGGLSAESMDPADKPREVGLKMKCQQTLVLLFFSFAILSNAHCSQSIYPFETIKKEAQFNSLLKEFRCLVCQNQDLADSNASLAKDLRLQVYDLVRNGKSDREIIDYLSQRYGDFILFKPPVKGLTLALWAGPFLFLIFGFIIFWRTCFK